jgi:HAD superfamily hydrolase (TIGR01549 family)
MPEQTWFLFDLGNTIIKLAYERVLENICKRAAMNRDELVELLEQPGAYRDLERGGVTFSEFHEFLAERAGYRGTVEELEEIWADFFDGTVVGIEEVLEKVRARYRVAFLSNSNEIHAELIPRRFSSVFKKDDRFIFSHRFKCAKPDQEMFHRALEVIGALPQHTVFIDDNIDNVLASRAVGMKAYHFRDSYSLLGELQRDGLLS